MNIWLDVVTNLTTSEFVILLGHRAKSNAVECYVELLAIDNLGGTVESLMVTGGFGFEMSTIKHKTLLTIYLNLWFFIRSAGSVANGCSH